MKSKAFLLIVLVFEGFVGWGQNKIVKKYDVVQQSTVKWNDNTGLPYKKVPGANLGATSFIILEQNRIAFLSDAANEIIITDKNNGKVEKKLSVIFAPRDFIYDNGFFYVLGERQVIVYDTNGKEKNQFSFPIDYYGRAARLARFNNTTYLLLGSGNSLLIEYKEAATSFKEYEGWATSNGSFIKTHVNGDNSYSVRINQKNGLAIEKKFLANRKAAGVFVIGTTKNRIILDVQTFVSESPVQIERFIVSVELIKNKLGTIISSIKVPDIYYVLSNKDFYVDTDGKIFNMISSPQGVYVFSLVESTSATTKSYPKSLTTFKYHFNNHLIKVDNNN